MIREWFSRRKRAAEPSVDTAVFLGAQFDLRDGQLEGLRDALAEAQQQLAVCRRELATYKAREFMVHAVRLRARLADEPTAVVSTEQLQRSRPLDAPTEQYRRP